MPGAALVRRLFTRLLRRGARPLAPDELGRSAVIFAPHPDDETLGCGGTIALKKQSGAQLAVVFLTDGSRSHRHLMDAAELKVVRETEARAATRVLGVEPDDLHFLGFEDGTLRENVDAAVIEVARLLERLQPEEVFVPHSDEGPPDHHKTHEIVHAALARTGRPAWVYEYAVWLWNHWPWVAEGPRRGRLQTLKDTVRSNLRLLRQFRCAAGLGALKAVKRAALDCHASQMTRLVDDARWLTLSDVSNGDFLRCFLGGDELFFRYRYP